MKVLGDKGIKKQNTSSNKDKFLEKVSKVKFKDSLIFRTAAINMLLSGALILILVLMLSMGIIGVFNKTGDKLSTSITDNELGRMSDERDNLKHSVRENFEKFETTLDILVNHPDVYDLAVQEVDAVSSSTITVKEEEVDAVSSATSISDKSTTSTEGTILVFQATMEAMPNALHIFVASENDKLPSLS